MKKSDRSVRAKIPLAKLSSHNKSPGSNINRSNISLIAKNYVNTNFNKLFPSTCKRFICPFDVFVDKKFVVEKSVTATFSSRADSDPDIRPGAVIVTTIHDAYDNLMELSLKNITTKRIMFQILLLLVPYLNSLTIFSIRNCLIDGYTIYELNKIIKASALTEICLDGSTVDGDGVSTILSTRAIVNFSLRMCKIDDETCRNIAKLLYYLAPAEPNLRILNLSTNNITDKGAKYLATALRSNRHLVYLNLANNKIDDSGASELFNVLMEFYLNKDETYYMKQRHLEYLRLRDKLRAENMRKQSPRPQSFKSGKIVQPPPKPITKKKTQVEREPTIMNDRASIKAAELLGVHNDPFEPDYTICKKGKYVCYGNFSLCYLNLSYNHLSYFSLSMILKVVGYQMQTKKKKNHTGLLKIMIEGNNLPVTCAEYNEIDNYTQRIIGSAFLKRPSKTPSLNAK